MTPASSPDFRLVSKRIGSHRYGLSATAVAGIGSAVADVSIDETRTVGGETVATDLTIRGGGAASAALLDHVEEQQEEQSEFNAKAMDPEAPNGYGLSVIGSGSTVVPDGLSPTPAPKAAPGGGSTPRLWQGQSLTAILASPRQQLPSPTADYYDDGQQDEGQRVVVMPTLGPAEASSYAGSHASGGTLMVSSPEQQPMPVIQWGSLQSPPPPPSHVGPSSIRPPAPASASSKHSRTGDLDALMAELSGVGQSHD